MSSFKDLLSRVLIINEAKASPYATAHPSFSQITSKMRSGGLSSAPLDTIKFIREVLYLLDIIDDEELNGLKRAPGFTGKKQAMLSVLKAKQELINSKSQEIADQVSTTLDDFINGVGVNRSREEKYAAQAAAQEIASQMRQAKSGKEMDDALTDIISDESILVRSAVAKILFNIKQNLGEPGFDIADEALMEVIDYSDKIDSIATLKSFIQQISNEPGYEKIAAYLSSAVKPIVQGTEDEEMSEDAEDSSATDNDITEEQNKLIDMLRKYGFNLNQISRDRAEEEGGPTIYMRRKRGPMHLVVAISPDGLLNGDSAEEYIRNYAEDAEDSVKGDMIEGEADTVWIGDDGEAVDGVVTYRANKNPRTGNIDIHLTGGYVTGNNPSARVDDSYIDLIISTSDYNEDQMADALADAELQFYKAEYEDEEYDSKKADLNNSGSVEAWEKNIAKKRGFTGADNRDSEEEESKVERVKDYTVHYGANGEVKRVDHSDKGAYVDPALVNKYLKEEFPLSRACAAATSYPNDTNAGNEDSMMLGESYTSTYIIEQKRKDSYYTEKQEVSQSFKERYKPKTSWQLEELRRYGM